MRIRVLFFASLRERLRCAETACDLPDGAAIADLWRALHQRYPALEPVARSVSFAVNQEYVDRAHRLSDGDEVALIPPVSGGVAMFRIVGEPIDLEELTARVAAPSAGAIVTFLGVTRNNNEGRVVTGLEYEAYPEMAVRELERIGRTARERWEINAIAIDHRVGRVPIGEASVGIVVSSAHRQAAFEACRFAIDRLKEVVPIWKKEYFEGGEIWIGSQTGERFPEGAR